MFKIIIKKDSVITNEALFATLEELETWKDYHVSIGTFNFENGNQTKEIIDITSQIDQETINQVALDYLESTDYLIIRELDNGTPCPAEIKTKRQEARSKIVR